MEWLRADIKYPTDSGLLVRCRSSMMTLARSARAASPIRRSSATPRRSPTTAGGIVVDYEIEAGMPPDAPRLAPAIDRAIAALNRQHGRDRARIRGPVGARIWCGWGVLCHNATKVAALTI